jgi:FlaA1/EpsC-like NDP-sugar epimerase
VSLKLISKSKKKNFFIIICADAILISIALLLTHFLRFDFGFPEQFSRPLKIVLPLVLAVKLSTFYFFDLYSGMYRYTSISDLFSIIKASTISSLLIIASILYITRFQGYSRSVFIIDWCFTIFLISWFRICIRIYFEHISSNKTLLETLRSVMIYHKRKRIGSKNLFIVGAGNCGEQIFREICCNENLKYNVIGFLDDDPKKIGKKIHGIPILGSIDELDVLSKKELADEVLIAIPSANSMQMQRIVAKCKNCGLEFKTIPSYGELINGRVTINSIREVEYRDLLGRESVKLDREEIGSYLKNQCILVTGAGGSIGSELCRQIYRFEPSKIILLERAESPLHDIELELRTRHKNIEIVPILGDIREKESLERIFQDQKPQTVFHAAAYKHVPMLENQPWKAIDNNIWGTLQLIEVVNQNNVDRFVFVSSDKAVRPTNVMGATKRVSEILIQSLNSCGISKTRFMIVRFGNVVGSAGSVIPLFKKQIKSGGPVTVTHPDVTRYFMTIPEACQLILQAGAMGKGGEIFVLDMGTPIKIVDLARDLIRLSGFIPDEEIKIEYIGLRPGEKLYEELITEGEGIIPTKHEKIMVLRGKECSLPVLNGHMTKLISVSRQQDVGLIRQNLKDIVPEYCPNGNSVEPAK